MNTEASKAYKGIGMDGPIASWYANITRKNIPDYRKDAARLTRLISGEAAVLDLAPGPGYLAIELAKLGSYRITGLDISETFVKIAQANAAEAGIAIEFRHGNAAQMPFEDESFDLIVCRAAFKNFAQPVAALDEMHRVLRAGGKAVIIDLRGDASDETIDEAVDNMGLNAINAFMTRWTFKHMLIKRAYKKEQFREMAAQSKFQTCEIQEDALGLDVYLKK